MLLKLLVLYGLFSSDRIDIQHGKIIVQGKNEASDEWKPIAAKLLVPLRAISRRKKNDETNARSVVQKIHNLEVANRQFFLQLKKRNLKNILKIQEYDQPDLRNTVRALSLFARIQAISLDNHFHPNISQRNESYSKDELIDIWNRSAQFQKGNDSMNDRYNSTKELLLNTENILENDDFVWQLKVLNEEFAKNSDFRGMQKPTSTKSEQERFRIFKRTADEIANYFTMKNLSSKQLIGDLEVEKFDGSDNVSFSHGKDAIDEINITQPTLIVKNRMKNSDLEMQESQLEISDDNNMVIGDPSQDEIREVSILSNGIEEKIIFALKSIEKEVEPEIFGFEDNNFPDFKKEKSLKKLLEITDESRNDEKTDESNNSDKQVISDKHISKN
ncbi:unnamed protein product [Onchocerca flexuosa]|uniref:Uncharacterized protein n=1 Tax=Onchocerca flexuosa TaxID=387005 RepID=A0A183H8Z3_9BILA|nr:unnamed protein product [Onchocerca flexuosa]